MQKVSEKTIDVKRCPANFVDSSDRRANANSASDRNRPVVACQVGKEGGAAGLKRKLALWIARVKLTGGTISDYRDEDRAAPR